VPSARDKVLDVPELPIATTPSVYEPDRFMLFAVSIVTAVTPAVCRANMPLVSAVWTRPALVLAFIKVVMLIAPLWV
jgi:hypothetical protein